MLQIEHINKTYRTGELVQAALDDVSLNLRDNEFVAVLGPSGSGKTTLLNIIGGLDRYDSGDLIINGISTKKYKDRDWDSYRNHTIGFVFQSYNLISHQSILSNVELALTISGVSRKERKKRAKEALEQVGLGDQIHKKPNQLSGGQMQRVAIARALVNNPDVLLADEPTGALDSETSVQVMNLLKEVAKDRLVVMVTHNPELAYKYANRIIKLKDGKITEDSNVYEIEKTANEPVHKRMGKASMSFLTALSLSFNNLKTKKGRTFLTSFAGSIGIIGIALILALSTGVNSYIENIQKDTMTSYPISIDAQAIDLSSIMEKEQTADSEQVDHKMDAVYSNGKDVEQAASMATSITENNLTMFKKHLDNNDSEINQYVGDAGIVYSYDTKFDVYTYDPDKRLVNTNGSTLQESMGVNIEVNQSQMSSMMNKFENNTEQLIPGKDNQLISDVVRNNYQIVSGRWPEKYNEIVLVLDENNEIQSNTLYELGLLPVAEYKKMMNDLQRGNEVSIESKHWSYENIKNKQFMLIPKCDYYIKNDNGVYDDISKDSAQLEHALKNAVELKITAIIKPKEDAVAASLRKPLAYTKALTDYLIDYANNSKVVKEQKNNKKVNVITGMKFEPSGKKAKIKDAKKYLANLNVSEKAQFCKQILQSAYASDPQRTQQLMAMDEPQLAAMLDKYLENPEDEAMLNIYDNYISPGSYDENLSNLGMVSLDAPSNISIYVNSFEDKDKISECIEKYNETVEEENKITYTDYIGLLMSSVTTIVNVISYVLIAFVAVSLIVSSIMIGIITYISVLERTKEIGILRAVGASKNNISQVFNAETLMIGLAAGIIGIGFTLLLMIPINAVIHSVADTTDVSAFLPVSSAVILIVLSMILTVIGGIIPSRKAAKKDPVAALRTE